MLVVDGPARRVRLILLGGVLGLSLVVRRSGCRKPVVMASIDVAHMTLDVDVVIIRV